MFDSLFSSGITIPLIFLELGITLLCGLVAAFIYSIRLRTSKGFFITIALMPVVVTIAFIFLNIMVSNDTTSTISKIAVVMVGLGLIRFRSAQGKAEEMLALFTAVVIGAISGLGYWLFAIIIAVVLPMLYVVLAYGNIFSNKKLAQEKLLKVTIPESLEYNDIFNETFNHFLKEVEMIGVKTTGMGSMFKLSYRIVMKNKEEEKEFIDELRTKNGNLEISILPYTVDSREL